MTNEEAELKLKELSEHYGQPVMPIMHYCDKLRIWARISSQAGIITKDASDNIQGQLSKSNLAYRLLYLNEDIRVTMCEIHKGHWSGCTFEDDETKLCKCVTAGNITGWLPNEK